MALHTTDWLIVLVVADQPYYGADTGEQDMRINWQGMFIILVDIGIWGLNLWLVSLIAR